MRSTKRVARRRFIATLVALAAAVSMLGGALPASADPPGTDDEAATPTLREQLETVSRSYYEAKSALTASRQRQTEIEKQLGTAEQRLLALTEEVSAQAAARYKGSRFDLMAPLLLENGSPEAVLRGASLAQYLVQRDDAQLRALNDAKTEAHRQRELLNAEILTQETQLAALDKQKRAAEKALAAVGGTVTAGFTGSVPAAQPAKRNADGSWPTETCSVNDPTTTGCITPRTYHALQEAKLAGFNRHVSCHRTGGSGEHPKGRACDFASAVNGFEGTATGAEKTYGNRLAAWCIKNADALGVLYVIWFHQIWMPGVGWRSYTGNGTPSGDHTNHVHLSII